MSEKYKVRSTEWPYFVTFTVIRWIDVFTRPVYRNIFINSLNYCIEKKGLKVHAWVLMTNNAHLLIDTQDKPLEHIIRDFKRHTSKMITQAIEDNIQESRDWVMYFFRKAGAINGMNKELQFWQNGYHPIHCWNHELIMQKINYIHQNPLRAELVNEIHEWKYSSASDYVLGHGLVNIDKLNLF